MSLRGKKFEPTVSSAESKETHMEKITGGAAISVPEVLVADFDVKPPGYMSIAGDFSMSEKIGRISYNFSIATRFYDRTFINDYGRGLNSVINHEKEAMQQMEVDHLESLVIGKDLEPAQQTTEVLFVANPRRAISPEAGIWLGRALALDNIASIYYLDEEPSEVQGFEKEEKVTRIAHYLDTFRLVSKSGEIELGFIEAIDMFGVNRAEAIK